VIRGIGHDGVHGVERGPVGARDEQRLAVGDDPLGDQRNLRRRLADAEDHFGESLADGAVGVDARKAEVVERRRAHRG
jgi:hypothetical protein